MFVWLPASVRLRPQGYAHGLPSASEIRVRERTVGSYFGAISSRSEPNIVFVASLEGSAFLDWRRVMYEFPERITYDIRFDSRDVPRVDVGFRHNAMHVPVAERNGMDPVLVPAAKGNTIVLVPTGNVTVEFTPETACHNVTPFVRDPDARQFQMLSCDLHSGTLRISSGTRSIRLGVDRSTLATEAGAKPQQQKIESR
jgi:hypothetical protein